MSKTRRETGAAEAGATGPASAASSIRCPFTDEPVTIVGANGQFLAVGPFWRTAVFADSRELRGTLDTRAVYPTTIKTPYLKCPFSGEKLRLEYSMELVKFRVVGPFWYTTWHLDKDVLLWKVSHRAGKAPAFNPPEVKVTELTAPPPNPVADQVEAARVLKDKLDDQLG